MQPPCKPHSIQVADVDRLYHTFDGIDRKQAVKNRDSEIEELYDHGADAITSILQAFMLAAALQLPAWAPNQAFGLLTLSLLAIFSTHLAADVMHTFVSTNFDVDEAQCDLPVLWHSPATLDKSSGSSQLCSTTPLWQLW